MSKFLSLIVVFICLISFEIQAQLPLSNGNLIIDTLQSNNTKSDVQPILNNVIDSLKPKSYKPDPMKVVWMGAIIPGYGQILNRRYWKLPIVYGGFMACAYFISWNTGKYQTYKTAYRDILHYSSDAAYKAIVDKDPSKASFYQILPKGYTNFDKFGGVQGYTNTLKTKQDSFRRYRDLSVFATIGYYAITIIEAYVDAQLYDFDISPDLSLKVQPTLINSQYGIPSILGLQCCLSLK